MAENYLDIVNDKDEIIGQELRSVIHRDGLLHREIHVWFITPDRKIIFQKRPDNKDTFPGYYDATAGGHVERGATYEEAALAEVLEETGLSITLDDLHFIDKIKLDRFDDKTGTQNYVFRSIYAYIFKGDTADLKIEENLGAGFKSVSLDLIYNQDQDLIALVMPRLIEPANHSIFLALEKLIA